MTRSNHIYKAEDLDVPCSMSNISTPEIPALENDLTAASVTDRAFFFFEKVRDFYLANSEMENVILVNRFHDVCGSRNRHRNLLEEWDPLIDVKRTLP